jgi:hypothetical protein
MGVLTLPHAVKTAAAGAELTMLSLMLLML